MAKPDKPQKQIRQPHSDISPTAESSSLLRKHLIATGAIRPATPEELRRSSADGPTPQGWFAERNDDPEDPHPNGSLGRGYPGLRRPWVTLRLDVIGQRMAKSRVAHLYGDA
jgi:hypothetical protein